MDVATKFFSTPSHDFTLLDAPGHADFVPMMITGAGTCFIIIINVIACTIASSDGSVVVWILLLALFSIGSGGSAGSCCHSRRI